MIIPKRHIQTFLDISSAEFISMQNLIVRLNKHFETNGSTGFHIQNNNGKGADQHVDHIHFHIFFRFPDDISPLEILSKNLSRSGPLGKDWNKYLNLLRKGLSSTRS